MKKKVVAVLFAIMTSVILAACGSSGGSKSSSAAYDTAEYAAEDYDYNYDSDTTAELATYNDSDANGYGSEETQVTENAQSTNRKLIKTVDLSVETVEYDALLANVQKEINDLGGYIESLDAYSNSYYSSNGRNANIRARIPATKLDGFVSKVGEEANVVNRSESVQDVTLNYVDMESHKKMLQTEQERLLELLETASDVEDIITIESRLSEVRYQIESMESQLRTYDNQVDYSTVTINISEVIEYTPEPIEGTWERIVQGFTRNLIHVGDGIKEFFIGLLINLPYIIIWAIVIIVVFLIGRKVIKKVEIKSDKKLQERLLRRQKLGINSPKNMSKTPYVNKPVQTNIQEVSKEVTTEEEKK